MKLSPTLSTEIGNSTQLSSRTIPITGPSEGFPPRPPHPHASTVPIPSHTPASASAPIPVRRSSAPPSSTSFLRNEKHFTFSDTDKRRSDQNSEVADRKDDLDTYLQVRSVHFHSTGQSCTVLYCTVLYCTVLYCTVLYCTVLFSTIHHFSSLLCLPKSLILSSFNNINQSQEYYSSGEEKENEKEDENEKEKEKGERERGREKGKGREEEKERGRDNDGDLSFEEINGLGSARDSIPSPRLDDAFYSGTDSTPGTHSRPHTQKQRRQNRSPFGSANRSHIMTQGTRTRLGPDSGISTISGNESSGSGPRLGTGFGIWNGTRTWIPGSHSASTMDSIPFPQVDLFDVTNSPENKVRWRGHDSVGSEDDNDEGGGEGGGGRGRGGEGKESDDKFEQSVVMNISCTASLSTNTTSSSVYGSMLNR